MLRLIRVAIFVLFLLLEKGAYSQQLTSRSVFKLKVYGDDYLKMRIGSDFKSIRAEKKFKIAFFFDLRSGWYTYSNKESNSNLPTKIELSLPPGFKIINIIWPETEDSESYYREDFVVIYELLSGKTIPEEAQFEGSLSCQCCDGYICNTSEVFFKFRLKSGKMVKSRLYRFINNKYNSSLENIFNEKNINDSRNLDNICILQGGI